MGLLRTPSICPSSPRPTYAPSGSSILIEAATVGYGRAPDFEPYAPDQLNMEQRIAYALRHDPVFRDAEVAEGIDPDKTPDPASLAVAGGARQPTEGRRGGRRLRAKL